MPTRKRNSDNSAKNSRPSSSKSSARIDESREESNSSLSNILPVTHSTTTVPEYALNTRVLCQHTDSFFYDAKIINVKKDEQNITTYTIHYNVSFKTYIN